LNPGDAPEGVSFNALLEGQKGIWCGTSRGLYRLEEAGAGPVHYPIDLGKPPANPSHRGVAALLKGRDGSIWAGTEGNTVEGRGRNRRVELVRR
jgi:ligand-binding sensor domain-containing protein